MRENKESIKNPERKGNQVGDVYQSEEYIDQFDQDAPAPGETQGLTPSSAPGQSFQRPRPTEPTTPTEMPFKGSQLDKA